MESKEDFIGDRRKGRQRLVIKIYVMINTIYLIICMVTLLYFRRQGDMVILKHPTIASCILFSILMYGNIALGAGHQQNYLIVGGMAICWGLASLLTWILKKILNGRGKE